MRKEILMTSAVISLSILSTVSPIYGQAMPDYLRDELNRSNRIITETNHQLETVIYPLAREQQAYEQRLRNICSHGNRNACAELQAIEQRRAQWMIQNNCRYRTGLNSCSR